MRAQSRDASRTDSAAVVPDTTKFKRLKIDIDQPVDFMASDSIVLIGKNDARMYGDSKVSYGNINLTAERLRMDMNRSEVFAEGVTDSIGEVKGAPVYTDASGEYQSKTMTYNFKTGKGYITDIVTEQGEGYLTGGVTKKADDDTYYIKDGRYTTCNNHEHPHFYFQVTKGKMTPKKNVVSGPVYMVLEDLPLPIAVPFGYFPFNEKYSSGVLFPTVGEDYNRGFYLRNGGYYFAINKYIDLALTGELYTRGSWGVTLQSNYSKRYKFNGNFFASYLTTVTGDKGEADYSKMHNFSVQWTHTQNQKANPNMTFSASVNFATSGYSRNNLDDYYRNSFTENTKSSTVNMTYRFPDSKWSLSTTANISQRTADSTLSV
ncbi:MAG: LPS-assembly protein LptD, partial [Muribaculaceae bacterium]|nr:LPS-assembly protein LptD [Muribaculaceae bacterium]